MMDNQDKLMKKNPFFKLLFSFLFIYALVHLNPVTFPSSWSSVAFNGPSVAYAEEEEEDFEEEFDEEEEESEEEEGDEEESAEGEEEEDLSYLTDIGPAADHEFGEFSFMGFSNRKITWIAAQLHILFASFILGCPMFVVIMEVMGARRTQGVRKAIILSNVFLGVLIGVVIGITGEIILDIHHGVLWGLFSCAFAALFVSFLNYFHRLLNVKVSARPPHPCRGFPSVSWPSSVSASSSFPP